MVRPNLGFWRQLIAFEQHIKGNAGSVRLVRDDAQPDCLLPDVYLTQAIPSRPQVILLPVLPPLTRFSTGRHVTSDKMGDR